MAIRGNRRIRPQKNRRIRKPATEFRGGIILPIVVPNHVRDMSDGLLVLVRRPSEIAPGKRRLRKVRRVRELPVKMQKRWTIVRLHGSHHMHGIPGGSCEPI